MCTNDILCKVYTCVLKCCTAYISRIATLSENDKYILHYDDVTMSLMASQITSLTIVYSTVYSGADQRKHQSSASLAFVRGIHRGPVNSQHKWPVTPKMFPFDDVIMIKSPWYTGGDFMFLYRFVRRRRQQVFVHAITFEQLFRFLSFLARSLALTYRLTD